MIARYVNCIAHLILIPPASPRTPEVAKWQFVDGSSVTMRPEGTAPAVRAYVAGSQWNPVTRWYYLGPHRPG